MNNLTFSFKASDQRIADVEYNAATDDFIVDVEVSHDHWGERGYYIVEEKQRGAVGGNVVRVKCALKNIPALIMRTYHNAHDFESGQIISDY
ncbi:hypothetical protein HF668_15515 [Acidithiobacillus ferridurans]|uniref:hypothetical protein n=1 Tax=Acidithiobacillus ferridurans TaxID=1232575 RepID=UPI001C06A09A|nr:hypothetical protein [Acidithiobacillus ferridurans]MBU2806518.1 hypothetical protein [Acidithiobacillus ferridurans]